MQSIPIAFLLSAPRSGSSLLLRMLHAHPAIRGLAEPHLLRPLARLAPRHSDPSPNHRERRGRARFFDGLPEAEAAHIEASRAYLDTLYGRHFEASPPGTRLLVDKTPANVTVVPFLRALYPQAPLIVLRRHPAAIAWSHARAFFGGDMERARTSRPVLREAIPPLAALIREAPAPLVVVDHETLVREPETEIGRVFAALGLPPHPDAVEYGRVPLSSSGDPFEVDRHPRPVPDLAVRWRPAFAAAPTLRRAVERRLDAVSDADLETWGTPRDALWDGLEGVVPSASTGPLHPYAIGRRALLEIRRDVLSRPHGRALLRVRDACSLLLDIPEENDTIVVEPELRREDNSEATEKIS